MDGSRNMSQEDRVMTYAARFIVLASLAGFFYGLWTIEPWLPFLMVGAIVWFYLLMCSIVWLVISHDS
jgi:inner membrane protein involved in colicin E2 resistance